jgi:hypothetical protein
MEDEEHMMAIEELQNKLESYPVRLQKALMDQSRANAVVEQIQEEIEIMVTDRGNPVSSCFNRFLSIISV